MKLPLPTLPTRLRPQRLSTRIVVVFLGLLLLVQAAGFAVIGGTIERGARATLAHELEVGERIWRRLLEQKSAALAQGATVLAADFGFRSAVASGDMATLASALENNVGRIGATVGAWVDTQLEVRAVHDERAGAGDAAALRHIAGELLREPRAAQVALVGGEPYQFVAVPVKAPLLIGWVVMGFPVNQALLDDMRKLSNMHVVLVVRDAKGTPQTSLSTLGSAAADALAGSGDSAVVGGEAMVLRQVDLAGAGGGGGASVLLLRSVRAAVAPFLDMQKWLLAVTLAGVAVFAIGSVVFARRITTPLRELAVASERLGRGDYTQAVQGSGRRDEIGALATAFDHMRVNIATHGAEIRQLAYWDRLTGLPNRAQFRETVQRAIDAAGAQGGTSSVLMLGLDRFKQINKELGYAAGDKVLQAVAVRLRGQVMREGEMLARITGDQFALLLPGVGAERALGIAARVGVALNVPLKLGEQPIDAPAAFGVASWPMHAVDADTLLNRAEVAMYAAKRKTVSALVYDPALDAGSLQSLSLQSDLRHALERNELRLFLQPKIALADGRLIGAEALVRWQHPTRGMVPPMEFIPFAEDIGFVCQLTLWVFETCARHWPALQAMALKRVSVNLSTLDLMDHELPAKLARLLARHDVPASAFCLEITESALMEEPQRALATLNALHDAGFKLSIDDFGTGHSSLTYLKDLPVDELKIDKSFVMAMERNPRDAMIVRSTIDLAHNLGMSVVAEGVENAAVMALLRSLACDEAQGYHMSRPLPAAELPAFASRWASRASGAASVALH